MIGTLIQIMIRYKVLYNWILIHYNTNPAFHERTNKQSKKREIIESKNEERNDRQNKTIKKMDME